MDPYEALTGPAVQSPTELAFLVDALRRRRTLGEVGAMTGDRVMAPFGNNMIQQADKYAGDVQNIRQRDADNAQTREYQTGQLDHMAQVLKETMANNLREDETRRRGQDMSLREAQYRTDNVKGGKAPRLRSTDITSLKQTAQAQSAINEMLNFQAKGGKLGAVGEIPILGSALRQASNYAASKGAGTDDVIDQKTGEVKSYGTKTTALQWQNYKRWYELAQRNNMFGATLTPNEMRAWASANPSAAQTDAQIAEGLKVMQKVYSHAQKALSEGLESEGYDPVAIRSYSSLSTTNGDLGIPKNFDMEGAQQYLAEHPETLPQFQEKLKELGLDPEKYTPKLK